MEQTEFFDSISKEIQSFKKLGKTMIKCNKCEGNVFDEENALCIFTGDIILHRPTGCPFFMRKFSNVSREDRVKSFKKEVSYRIHY